MDIMIHFVGCLGVSMKTLMSIFEHKGFMVSGSDFGLNGHDAKNVEGADLVVYTAAIPQDNPELERARQLGIPLMTRGEMLGELMLTYSNSVAVAGAHGKTTTTGMLWETLLPLNPTVHIGGNYNNKSSKIGGGKLFISEACEYKRSFLNLRPDIAVILNIDLDHTDCYADLADMTNAFKSFASNACKTIIINGDELEKQDFFYEGKNTVTVGLKKTNDYYATCLTCDKFARFSFCVHKRGIRLGRVSLCVAGAHNVINALSVIAVADELKLSFGRIAAGLYRFKGAQRRMEFLGYKEGTAVFTDYAHHHKEIATTIASAKASRFKHITAVFEPHTYTRTKSFCGEFAAVLAQADSVVLLPVYPAREKPIENVSSALILDELKKLNKESVILEDYQSAKTYLKKNLADDGVILFMGAGTIDNLAREFTNPPQSNIVTAPQKIVD